MPYQITLRKLNRYKKKYDLEMSLLSSEKEQYDIRYKQKYAEVYEYHPGDVSQNSFSGLMELHRLQYARDSEMESWLSKNKDPTISFDEWMTKKIGWNFVLTDIVIVL